MKHRWHIPALCLLAVATSAPATRAQSPYAEEPPFVDSFTGVEPWRVAGSHVRFGAVGGQGIDFQDPFVDAGFFIPTYRAAGVVFLDVQAAAQFTSTRYESNNLHAAGNVGLGYRAILGSEETILGASFWYDADGSREEMYNQLGLSLEGFFDEWEVRNNYYFPIDADSRILTFSDETIIGEVPLKGIELEGGRRIEDLFGSRYVGVYGGFYHCSGDDVGSESMKFFGGYARVEARVTNNVFVHTRISGDPRFGTNFFGGVTVLFPVRPRPTEGAYDRMLLPVRRRQFVAVGRVVAP